MDRLIRKTTFISPVEELYIMQGVLKWRCAYCRHVIKVWAGTRRGWDHCPNCKMACTKYIDEERNAY